MGKKFSDRKTSPPKFTTHNNKISTTKPNPTKWINHLLKDKKPQIFSNRNTIPKNRFLNTTAEENSPNFSTLLTENKKNYWLTKSSLKKPLFSSLSNGNYKNEESSYTNTSISTTKNKKTTNNNNNNNSEYLYSANLNIGKNANYKQINRIQKFSSLKSRNSNTVKKLNNSVVNKLNFQEVVKKSSSLSNSFKRN